jgi:hypothetical protein
MTDSPFRPLVVGSPRTGFALLCSILGTIAPLARRPASLRQSLLNILIDRLGDHVANEIVRVARQAGVSERLVYSPNFRLMTGGPKWLSNDFPGSACFRKYVGVRGIGDFTLITRHPRQVLERDDILHSHVDALRWSEDPYYADFMRFASVRYPAGIVASSLLSINALTSEYIQKFLLPEQDNHAMREHIALFKFSNLDFFRGLVKFYTGWFREFLPLRDRYTIMRWEDLLTEPARTISSLAAAAGIPIEAEHAADIWAGLAHRNLTGAHKHNFRVGGGRVGDWKNWLTNRHLDILREEKYDEIGAALGYPPLPVLDEAAYTPFQKQVDGLLAKGEVYDDYHDRDLFLFAFNKSNMDSSKFPFKRYGWRTTTQVERADFSDEALMNAMWEAADAAVARLNRVFDAVGGANLETACAARTAAGDMAALASEEIGAAMPRACEGINAALIDLVRRWFDALARNAPVPLSSPPRLLREFKGYNIVAYEGSFIGLPQSVGPIDLQTTDARKISGAVVAGSLAEAETAIRSLVSI